MDFEYSPPFASHMHGSARWEKQDTAHPDPVVEKELNYTRHAPRPPRPVFLHVNVLKMDPGKLLLDEGEITFEPDGTPHRMWGLREDIVRLVGYDVEERLWGAVVEEGCREDRGSEMCRRLLEWSREVLGWMESIDRPW
jgi:alpha 1,2-mannosyltransferase